MVYKYRNFSLLPPAAKEPLFCLDSLTYGSPINLDSIKQHKSIIIKSHFLTKIFNLMKKMIRTTLFSLSFVVAFLFVGTQSANAQFLDNQDAMSVLVVEIQDLAVAYQGATAGTGNHVAIGRKMHYYRYIAEAIDSGMDTEQAIDHGYSLLPELAGLQTLTSGPVPAPANALRKNLRTEAVNLLTN